MLLTARRQLELAFVFRGNPFAWRCSLCRKLFASTGTEMNGEALADIDRNFLIHVCYPLLDLEAITEFDSQPVPSSLKFTKER